MLINVCILNLHSREVCDLVVTINSGFENICQQIALVMVLLGFVLLFMGTEINTDFSSNSTVIFLSLVLLTVTELVSTSFPCIETCNKTIHKGVKLSRLMKRNTGALIKTYVSKSPNMVKWCQLVYHDWEEHASHS